MDEDYPHVTARKTSEVGSCNFCNVWQSHVVYIAGRTTVFRMCDECTRRLIDGIKEIEGTVSE